MWEINLLILNHKTVNVCGWLLHASRYVSVLFSLTHTKLPEAVQGPSGSRLCIGWHSSTLLAGARAKSGSGLPDHKVLPVTAPWDRTVNLEKPRVSWAFLWKTTWESERCWWSRAVRTTAEGGGEGPEVWVPLGKHSAFAMCYCSSDGAWRSLGLQCGCCEMGLSLDLGLNLLLQCTSEVQGVVSDQIPSCLPSTLLLTKGHPFCVCSSLRYI